MTYALVAAVVVIWVLLGLLIRLLLARRGHRGTSVATAVVAGPLLALALPRAAPSPRIDEHVKVVAPGGVGPGVMTVVVGVDGSDQARAAVRSVVDLFGSQIKALTLASVVGMTHPDAATRQHSEHVARACLDEMAGLVSTLTRAQGCPVAAEQILLTGEPARELVELARLKEADLLVVGRRGAGLSKVLLGSVATQLVSKAPVPVVVVGT